MHMTNIHCLHVQNCLTINITYCVKQEEIASQVRTYVTRTQSLIPRTHIKQTKTELGIVAHTCHPSAEEGDKRTSGAHRSVSLACLGSSRPARGPVSQNKSNTLSNSQGCPLHTYTQKKLRPGE